MTRSTRRSSIDFRHIVLVCLFSLVFDATTAIAHPQQTSATPKTGESYAAAREDADRKGKEWLARGIPGFAMAVAVDGRIVYSEAFGYADLEERVAAWPTTKFRIGSISKPLTAAALVRLVEQRKIDLDAPIQKYVPSFPDKGATITVRMLAGHLGGIRHYKNDEFLIAKHYATVLDGLKIFQDDPLVSAPGTKFNYSSYGFNLLSAGIERACAEEFLRCIQDLVFTPLSLRHTVADQPAEIIEQRSRFYTHPMDRPVQNAPFVDNSYKWAGGGFLSTAEDLVQFASALLEPGYLKPESLRLLFTSQKTSDGQETGYGVGWSIGKSKSGQRVYEHSGGSVGGTSQLILYPDAKLAVALVTNFEEGWKKEDVENVGEAFEIKQK